MTEAAIVRTVAVDVEPHVAFEIFTNEIGEWWHSADHSWQNPARAVGMIIEPFAGGRWLEVWDATTGEGTTWGHVIAWQPGRRLVVTYEVPDCPAEPPTELEITFEPIDDRTRVTLTHSGLDRLAPAARSRLGTHAWTPLVTWYRRHIERRGHA